MSDLSLKLLLLGQDVSASKALKGVGDDADKVGSKASKLGKAVGIGMAGIGIGIGALLKTGWDETKDASAGQAQLEAGLKSTGNAAGVTVAGMENLSSTIQNYSGQTDDSIVATEQLLLTFTNIKNVGPDKIFDQATTAAADMAAKMGGDAASKAVLLGKALNDPVKGITALTRVGVAFTDAQKKQIKAMQDTGDTVGAQKVILGELNKEFGGAAKAAGESVPGQMARAKRSFEDTSQTLVTSLLPVINSLLNVILNDVMPAIQGLINFWVQHKTIMTLVVAVIATAVTVFKAIELATKAWAAAQAALNVIMSLNPIALIVIAIIALIAIIVLIATKTTWFQTIWNTAWAAIKAAAVAVFNWIKSNWPLILAILTGPIGLAVLTISRHWTSIKNAGVGVFNWIKSNWPLLLAVITGPFGLAVLAIVRNWTSIKNGATNAKNFIVDAFNSLVGFFTGLGPSMASAGKSFMSSLWNGIKSGIGDVGGFVADIGSAIRNGINGILHLPITIPRINTHLPGIGTVGGETLIPALAQGGIVPATRGGRIIRVSEAGYPEAIVPLKRGMGGMGGGNVNITFTGPIYGIDQLSQAVMVAAEKASLNQGRRYNIKVAS